MQIVSLSERVKFYEKVFGPGRIARNSKNFDVRCPICAPKDQSKKKLSILVDDDRNHCWTCGWKSYNLLPLIMRYGTTEQLVEYKQRFIPTEIKSKFELDPENVKEIVRLPPDFKLLTLASLSDPDVLAVRNYLLDRNVTENDMWRYKLGCSNSRELTRRVVFPSFDVEGTLNFFVGRSVDRFVRPKYVNPHVDRLNVIFNEIDVDWNSELVLCEGVFDMVKCGDNAVPLLGSDLNEQSLLFNRIIFNKTPIALALDGDMRVKKTPKIAKKLVDYNVNVRIVDVRLDPGEMSKDEFKEALALAKPYDWYDEFHLKLNAMVM